MGVLALFALSLWLVWLFYCDGKERASVSPAVWIVMAWAVLHGTRPVTSWFAGVDPDIFRSQSRDEGNLGEALVNLLLIIAGLNVLGRRSIRLSTVIRDNKWLSIFYLFWLISIMWSDYPLITVKRLFKDLGNVIMVLVVLAEKDPGETIKAICVRLAYVTIPLSILMYRYYPAWGRAYVGYKHDIQMFVGVATHKNTLGVLAFVGAVFLLWDFLERRRKQRSVTGNLLIASHSLLLLMCWYLLLRINSVTSLICAVFGSALLIVLSFPSIRRRPGRVEAFGLCSLMALWLFNLMFDIKAATFQILERNETLTTRTDIWPVLINSQDNPLLGSGFNTFWAGRRLELLADKTFGIIQAHNGYLETYLNGGLVGLGLLLVLILSAYMRIRKQLATGIPEGSIRFVVLLMAIIYNYSEASFSKVGLLWLVTLFAIMQYRSAQPPFWQAVRTTTVLPIAGSDARMVETP
ncbi:MAG: O-antigen ligase family protein [Nitrospirales bacterium]